MRYFLGIVLLGCFFFTSCGDSEFTTFDGDEVSSITVEDGENFQVSFRIDLTQFSCSIVNEGNVSVVQFLGSESTPVPNVEDRIETRFKFSTTSPGTTLISFNCENDPSDTEIRVTVN